MNSLKRYRVGRRELPASVVRRVVAQREPLLATRRERQPCNGQNSCLDCDECDRYYACMMWDDWDDIRDEFYRDWQENETFREYMERKRPQLLTVKLWEAA